LSDLINTVNNSGNISGASIGIGTTADHLTTLINSGTITGGNNVGNGDAGLSIIAPSVLSTTAGLFRGKGYFQWRRQ